MELPWTRAEDLVPGPPPGGAVDPTPLLGDWRNTDHESRGIVRLVVAADGEGGGITVQAWGAATPAPLDWGRTRGAVYAEGPGGRSAAAFGAFYDHGFQRVHLQAKVNRGVLVVAMFNEFTDGSGRSSYFTREFYYR
jgi:hypothetical protein